MGPGLAAGLGGTSRTARASGSRRCARPLHAHVHACCPVPRCSTSVCHRPQTAIFALSGPIETSWVAMAQLDEQLQRMQQRREAIEQEIPIRKIPRKKKSKVLEQSITKKDVINIFKSNLIRFQMMRNKDKTTLSIYTSVATHSITYLK